MCSLVMHFTSFTHFVVGKSSFYSDESLSFFTVFFGFLALAAVFGVFHMLHALKDGSKARFDAWVFPIFTLAIFFIVLSNSAQHTRN